MGNLINEILYIIGIFRKRIKLITLCKNNRIKIDYLNVDKDGKLIKTKKEAKGILENITIKSTPAYDDTTGQPVYFVSEGATETIDVKTTTLTSEQDSIALANALERGRQLERMTINEEGKRDAWTFRLLVISVAGILFALAGIWTILQNMGVT